MNRAIITVIAIGAVALLLAAAGSLAPLAANAGPASTSALLGPDAPVQHTPYNPQIPPTSPEPTSVSYWGTPASGDTYGHWEDLQIEVKFSEAVSVTGTPQLEIQIGSATRHALYVRGSGTDSLRFEYRVSAHHKDADDNPDPDRDTDGFSVNGAAGLNLDNGATIKSVANPTTDADTALSGLSLPTNNARHKVNAVNSVPKFAPATWPGLEYVPGQLIDTVDLPAASDGDGTLTYHLNNTEESAPCGTATGASVSSSASRAGGVSGSSSSSSLLPPFMSYYPPGSTYNGATVAGGGKIAPNGTLTPGTNDAMVPTCFKLIANDTDRDSTSRDSGVLTFTVTVLADYDSDDDGLIDVDSLAKLDAIRYDLDGNGAADNTADASKYAAVFLSPIAGMGCPLADHDNNAATPKAPVCTGYELDDDLDFDTDKDGATYTVSTTGAISGDADDAYYNGGKGWTPIGTHAAPFSATFDGDDKIIANLFIHWAATDTGKVGLFGQISASGIVRDLGLTDVSITGPAQAGSLAGSSNGAVSNCYATGSVASLGARNPAAIGGLVGLVNGGTITSSYAAVAVSGRTSAGTGRDLIGGLVGKMLGSTAVITASYATGAVSSGATNAKVGGLVGNIYKGAAIISSYATGAVSGSGSGNVVGGLVGGSGTDGGSITASYAAGTVTGGSNSHVGGLYGSWQIRITDSYAVGAVSGGAGSKVKGLNPSWGAVANSYWDTGTTGQTSSDGGTGKTTRELQSPTSNTGIYASWQTAQWDFGTSRQYPAVKHNGEVVPGQRQTSIRSDHWNAPVVGEPVTAGLHVAGNPTAAWQWQSSANGATWANIAGATAAAYIPVAADAANGGKFLRAKVTFTLTLSGQMTTQTLTTVNTAKVIASTTVASGGAAAITPIVGEKLRAYHPSVTAVPATDTTSRTVWRWLRCDDAAMAANCVLRAESPTSSAHTEYTPVAGTDTDVGKYLRAYAYYAAGGSSDPWTRTQTAVLGPVAAAAPAATTP